MSQDSSVTYYQDNKERLQKKKDMKVFLEQKKKKRNNMFLDDAKIYQKSKNKTWFSIEKNNTKREKIPCNNCKKLFSFGKFGFFGFT